MASTKEIHECAVYCNSRRHSQHLTSSVTISKCVEDEKLASYIKWVCPRFSQGLDTAGRTLLHMVASKGRLQFLKWLIAHKDVNINVKDGESGYTALHRSIFYGHIDCAIRLIQAEANVGLTDNEHLTCIDHLMKDRLSYIEYTSNYLSEVYVWGTNSNYTLGTGSHHSTSLPETIDVFRKKEVYIKQVLMNKFHTIFVSCDGKVWSCGHGTGGRLGLDDESTTLPPKLVKIKTNNSSDRCICVSIGKDHSILLLENGSVWSFGSNLHHQLGHDPPPDKLLSPKPISNLRRVQDIVGVRAARFHSVVWTKEKLFTCGLHAGHLGHYKSNEKSYIGFKQVTSLPLKDGGCIQDVAVSDGATVVVSNKGDVYLLHEYQTRKLTHKNRQFDIIKVCVFGGNLDYHVDKDILKEKGGSQLKITFLTKSGQIFVWQECTQHFLRCQFSLKRQIYVTDIALNMSGLILCTKDGEAFSGEFRVKKMTGTPKLDRGTIDIPDKDAVEHLKIKRVANIHRAVSVASDSKGRNFGVIQTYPKSFVFEVPQRETYQMKEQMKNLLQMRDETVCDVKFQVGDQQFLLHQYILCHTSPSLENMIQSAREKDCDSILLVKINNIHPQIFEQIVQFIYTRDCELLHEGISPVILFDDENNQNKTPKNLNSETKKKNKKNNNKEIQQSKNQINPVRLAREAAKKLEISELHKMLEHVRYDDGYIRRTGPVALCDTITWDRKKFQHLWDIVLQSNDNTEIKAHKCILVARLEYFSNMFMCGWLESTRNASLKLPIPGNILDILIRYLYTDQAPELKETGDPDLASHVLLVADQVFCTGLKEVAELALANLLSLKNAADILQLAVTYNAHQLKQYTLQFICQNLAPLLESRSLEILNDDVLIELSSYYQSQIPSMCKRIISQYRSCPDIEFINRISQDYPVSFNESIHVLSPIVKQKSSTKKRVKKTSVSLEEKVRHLSFTSDDDCEVKNKDNAGDESWVKVEKHNKASIKIELENKIKKVPDPIPKSKLSAMFASEEPAVFSKLTPITKTENYFTHFPSLQDGPVEKAQPLKTSSHSESFKKKIPHKEKKKLNLAIQKSDNPWGVRNTVPETSFDVIMKEEGRTQSARIPADRRNQPDVVSPITSPSWQDAVSPGSSLSAIMAAEQQQKNKYAKMKSKSLQLTQLEDRAIQELIVFYNVEHATDERITVSRVKQEGVAPPVWVSSHR